MKNEKTTHKLASQNSQKTITVLGIDPGIANTGYAITTQSTENFKYSVLESGCIRTSAKLDEAERLLKISEKIKSLLDEFKPTALAIERVFHNRNITSSISTAQVIGICQLIGIERGLHIYQITPQKVKAAAGCNAKASKKSIQTRIRLITNAQTKSHHATDACSIAISAIMLHRSKTAQTKIMPSS